MTLDRRAFEFAHQDRFGGVDRVVSGPSPHRVELQTFLHRQRSGKNGEQVDLFSPLPRLLPLPLPIGHHRGHRIDPFPLRQLHRDILQTDICRVELELCLGFVVCPGPSGCGLVGLRGGLCHRSGRDEAHRYDQNEHWPHRDWGSRIHCRVLPRFSGSCCLTAAICYGRVRYANPLHSGGYRRMHITKVGTERISTPRVPQTRDISFRSGPCPRPPASS